VHEPGPGEVLVVINAVLTHGAQTTPSTRAIASLSTSESTTTLRRGGDLRRGLDRGEPGRPRSPRRDHDRHALRMDARRAWPKANTGGPVERRTSTPTVTPKPRSQSRVDKPWATLGQPPSPIGWTPSAPHGRSIGTLPLVVQHDEWRLGRAAGALLLSRGSGSWVAHSVIGFHGRPGGGQVGGSLPVSADLKVTERPAWLG
jgi:hypothetical protein